MADLRAAPALRQQQAQVASDAVGEHPERQLLAYAFGKFKENDLLGIKTEAEKTPMLAALILVECISEAAPPTAQ